MDSPKSDTAYRVLARKYRPQNFDDLIGQEPMVRTLTNAFDMNRIAQAWMLTGVRGVGKTTTARILARALNYKTDKIDRPTVHMPVLGEHCRAIMEGRHVDVVEMDAASHTGIDDIREIIEQIRYRPVSARYKVYIIDEVHMLSNQAFNGLLKTLEEPPPHAKFIFATTEIRKVPVTVLSRCQRFDLRRVDAAVLTQHLQKIAAAEQIEAEPEALAMIARAGEGSVRDCLSMLDQAIAHSGIDGGEAIITAAAVRDQLGLADKSQIITLFGRIMAGQPAQALAQIQRLYEYGADPVIIIRELLEFNHFVTRLKFQPDMANDLSLSEEERREGAAFAAKISVRVLSRSWQMLLKGLNEAENAAHPLAAAEMLLIRLCHAADLPNLDEALRFLEQQKSGGAPAIAIMQPAALAAGQAQMARLAAAEVKAEEQEAAAKTDAAPIKAAAQAAPAAPQAEPAAETPAESPAPAPQPQSAEAPAPAPQSPPAKVPAPENKPAKLVKKNSEFGLKQLAAMADKAAKPLLKFYISETIRPIELRPPQETAMGHQPGLVRFAPLDTAPADIERQIAALLQEETGERWQIEVQAEGGGQTLQEEQAEHKAALFANAQKNADVQAVLSLFPSARLVDVRLKNTDIFLPGADAEPQLDEAEEQDNDDEES